MQQLFTHLALEGGAFFAIKMGLRFVSCLGPLPDSSRSISRRTDGCVRCMRYGNGHDYNEQVPSECGEGEREREKGRKHHYNLLISDCVIQDNLVTIYMQTTIGEKRIFPVTV